MLTDPRGPGPWGLPELPSPLGVLTFRAACWPCAPARGSQREPQAPYEHGDTFTGQPRSPHPGCPGTAPHPDFQGGLGGASSRSQH